MRVGIDFGTTNSAVAVLDGTTPRILELTPGARTQRTVIHCTTGGRVSFGNAAFDAYIEADLTGRFLRSLKAFLSQDVPRTTLGRRRYAFPELVTAYLRFLVERVEAVTGQPVDDVVVGRPVRFHADPERDRAAQQRLETAITDAGLPGCRLKLEPVAAAHRYERDLTEARTVLVGDFGGGTADFAVLRGGRVLSTSGVAQAGDALDGRFMDAFLMPWFGRGARLTEAWGGIEWRHPIQRAIQRLYYIHLLRTDDLHERLQRLERRVRDPAIIRRLQRLVFDDLGYPMAWSIEATKRALSEHSQTVFRFEEFYSETLNITQPVDREAFAEASGAILDAYRGAIQEALAAASLGEDGIDDVFLTGGTSNLPFIRALFADTFGADRLRSSDAFTTVCEGLVLD